MVHVQQGALGAFKQDGFTALVQLVQGARHVGHHRLDALGQLHGLFQGFLEVHGVGLEVFLEQEVIVSQVFAQLGGKTLGVEQILHADGTTGHLVFVGRANATAGGADLVFALGGFARLVQRDVVGQDQRAGFGNLQAAGHVDAGGLQFVDFLQQRFRRQHHAIADKAGLARMQHAGRNQAQHGFLAIHHQGVASVVAALEAHHALGVIGQPVNNLAFAFVTPLGADHDYVLGHEETSLHNAVQWEANGSTCQPSARQTSARSQLSAAADSPR